jgi:hypothetical protein
VFFLIYVGASVFAVLVLLMSSGNRHGYGQRPGDVTGLATICWSCFGIFLMIAMLSLLQQTRTLVRDRINFGARRRVKQM